MNTAIGDIEGKSINPIKVTHKNKQSENNNYNILAQQFGKIALVNITTVYFGLYYKPGDQIVQNYNFVCFIWLCL
jgi:hypothetical protein